MAINIIIGLIILCGLIMLLSIILSDPISLYKVINKNVKTFRIYKPRNSSYYYLQVRVLFIYYYIEYTKHNESYNLLFFKDIWCIKTYNHLITNKKEEIYNKRYDIIKFFSDTSSPEDIIKL